jgi:hypothetical protein
MPSQTLAKELTRGRQVASLLAGAWRVNPPPLQKRAEEIAALVPLLLKTGAAPLAWWKVRNQLVPDGAQAGELKQEYHLHRLESFTREVQLEEILGVLRRGGVEPLLAKGWAVAQRYPAPGLRPFGDFDLLVAPSHFEEAVNHLAQHPLGRLWVDLHRLEETLPDRSVADLYLRAQTLALRGTVVRTLGTEDHLRFLCLHFARHGGWRPLWLCDIGAFLESTSGALDVDYLLSGDLRLTAWVRAVLGLAVRLLGARLAAAGRLEAIASEQTWLDRLVLREWGRGQPGDSRTRDKRPMTGYLFRPWGLLEAVRRRIPNRLEAAFKRHAFPQNNTWLGWCQVEYCWRRVQQFAGRLPSIWPPRHQGEFSGVQVHVRDE